MGNVSTRWSCKSLVNDTILTVVKGWFLAGLSFCSVYKLYAVNPSAPSSDG